MISFIKYNIFLTFSNNNEIFNKNFHQFMHFMLVDQNHQTRKLNFHKKNTFSGMNDKKNFNLKIYFGT